MELALQQVVDELADKLGRPTVLEDHSLRLIAYSQHERAIDDVRESSILLRHATPEVAAWLNSLGVRQARRPIRVPGNADLHMLPRVCVPIVYDGIVLAHLWFVDADATMSSGEIDDCLTWADQLAGLLHREQMSGRLTSARLAKTLENLLSGSTFAAEAARALRDEGEFDASVGVVVATIQVLTDEPDQDVDIEDFLVEAIVTHQRSPRRLPALTLARPDHAVLLYSCADDHNAQLSSDVSSLQEALTARVPAGNVSRLVAGIGGHRELEHAAQSFREARMAVQAATTFTGLGDVVRWSQLGVGQVLVKLAAAGEKPPIVHPGLHRLFESQETLPLVETLETFLDVAGNVQLTAQRLNLHRTSLYYRLQRVEQLAATDLKDGSERLALHFALKVARMTGEYVPRQIITAN